MRTDIFLDAFGGTRTRGRICTRCGGRHSATGKWCKVCLELTGWWRETYRNAHKDRKLCPRCPEAKGRDSVECDYHREYHAALIARLYAEKRAAGLCTYGACRARVLGSRCSVHSRRT